MPEPGVRLFGGRGSGKPLLHCRRGTDAGGGPMAQPRQWHARHRHGGRRSCSFDEWSLIPGAHLLICRNGKRQPHLPMRGSDGWAFPALQMHLAERRLCSAPCPEQGSQEPRTALCRNITIFRTSTFSRSPWRVQTARKYETQAALFVGCKTPKSPCRHSSSPGRGSSTRHSSFPQENSAEQLGGHPVSSQGQPTPREQGSHAELSPSTWADAPPSILSPAQE